jgi:protoheme IX farnesyltransferase
MRNQSEDIESVEIHRTSKDIVKALVDIIKPKQTFLLMVTFAIAYVVASTELNPVKFIEAAMAVFLAISGTTALNMWLDRDIDALMSRTRTRPVPRGVLKPVECAVYGFILFATGIFVGISVGIQFITVLFLGLFFDIAIYTVLLKRKSPYSIILGGFAGAMPALAGWVAASGFSPAGLIIAGIVLLWIPSHIWYISMHYEEDYRKAGIPMYPLVVGMEKASWAIVLATSAMLLLVSTLLILLPLSLFYPAISLPATMYFLYKAIKFARHPDRMRARKMYKLASMTLGAIYFSMLIGAIT